MFSFRFMKFDTNQARRAWTAAEPLLERAVSRLIKLANGKACLSSFGISPRQSWSHAKEGSLPIEATDVVSISWEPWRDLQFAFRTPWIYPWLLPISFDNSNFISITGRKNGLQHLSGANFGVSRLNRDKNFKYHRTIHWRGWRILYERIEFLREMKYG